MLYCIINQSSYSRIYHESLLAEDLVGSLLGERLLRVRSDLTGNVVGLALDGVTNLFGGVLFGVGGNRVSDLFTNGLSTSVGHVSLFLL